TIELHGVTLAHSPLQNFFDVLTFKTALEETRGTLTADKLADLYDEHVRFANPDVLCDPDIAQLLLHADEAEKKAFSHWSKYQILVQKGRTPEGIRWLFMAVFDGHEAGYLSSEKLSTRNLQAITCQALLAQKHLLQLILEKIDTDFTDYPAAIKFTCNQGYLRRYDLESWMATISGSSLDACFCDGHWATLVGLVKNRRALTEYLSAPSISQEMNDIEEKYAAEVKEKKKKIKRAAGEQHEEEEAEKQADEPEEEEEDPQQTELKHMLVGEEPNLPIPEQELKGEKLASKLKEKFMQLKKLAQRKVATTVKLIVDPGQEDKLVDLYVDSWIKDYKDEKRQNQPGEEPFSTKLLGHFFDSKKCSEAASAPHLRPPPLKEGRAQRILSAIVRVRFPVNADGAPTFSDGDIFFMNDGGRPGHHNQLTTLKSGDDAVQKFEKVLAIIYSEESLAARKERNKMAMGAIKQLESVYMLMPPCGLRVMKKARLHHDGSNRGDSIYGVNMPAFDAKTTWVMCRGCRLFIFIKSII
ncbi:unnamed protein product, partial [Cladocopium goreaui]